MRQPLIDNIPNLVRQIHLLRSTPIGRQIGPLLPNRTRRQLNLHLLFDSIDLVHTTHEILAHDGMDLGVVQYRERSSTIRFGYLGIHPIEVGGDAHVVSSDDRGDVLYVVGDSGYVCCLWAWADDTGVEDREAG